VEIKRKNGRVFSEALEAFQGFPENSPENSGYFKLAREDLR